MRIIRGAPGAGKTKLIFEEFKEALRAGETTLRIVVPTATLVRHFRHELARDGVIFSPNTIVSLARFAAECAPDMNPVPDGLRTAIVRDCLDRLKLPEFAGVATADGMIATLLDTIDLFENAACTPNQLGEVRKFTPHAKAFHRLWQAVDDAIHKTGYHNRTSIFRAAAANHQPARIWMDGFLAFSPLERELVRALASSCDLTVTAATTGEIAKLALQLGAKDELLKGPSRKPQTTVIEARTPEREADEIARRIIETNRAGTPFRRIGIALRDTATYLPLLRTTLDRFGIPARFYFSQSLRTHPAAVFLNGLIEGALTGWDFQTTLETLRAHPRWGHSADFDRFDYIVREAMPGHGADALLALCDRDWLKDQIANCLKTDAWINDKQTPSAWQWRLERLAATIYRPGTLPAPRDHEAVATARSHVAAIQSWLEAIDSIVSFWTDPQRPIALQEFWRIASFAIDTAVLRPPDDRAEVVHVMSAYEARQWDLAALFVCGMVDRDFPKRQPQNLLFPDTLIDRLRLPLRKAADEEADERLLSESLQSRATDHVFLSYPIRDASGKSAQRSRFIDAALTPERAIPCRPAALAEPSYAGAAGHIHAPELLTEMAALHKSISLTALEDLAQCRFKFFANKTLSLKGSPERPAERLQARVTGSILHEALERWLTDKDRNFVEIFEETFDDNCRKLHIPPGYRLEVERIQFREIAERMSANERWKPDSSDVEVKLALEFPGGVTVNCRIDRIDKFNAHGNDCVIVDYKSSKTARVEQLVESRVRLQGPLYALAVREGLNLNPVAMLYWAVREDELYGWGRVPGTELSWREMPPNWAADARARTIERLTGFFAGAVMAHPEEQEQCRWCDFNTACRVEQEAAQEAALISIGGVA